MVESGQNVALLKVHLYLLTAEDHNDTSHKSVHVQRFFLLKSYIIKYIYK
jgi:hypothetical protein